MLKKLHFIKVVLISLYLLPLSQAVSGASKTFFAPQSLSSMLNFLQMPPKKIPACTPAKEQSNLLAFSSTPHSTDTFVLQDTANFYDRFAPEKNSQLLFAYNDNTQNSDTSSSWYKGASSNRHASSRKNTEPLSLLEKPRPTSLLSLSESPQTQNWTIAITPFYIRSTNGNDLRHYYFPEGKDELIISGSLAPVNDDISGSWLRIVGVNANPTKELLINSFQSNFQVNPTYKYVGTNIHFHKQVGVFWGEAQIALAQASVNHGIRESNILGNVRSLDTVPVFLGNGGNPQRTENCNPLYSVDAASAFSQQSWLYHKLSKQALTQVGIGDTIVKLGYMLSDAQLFARIVLPTSNNPTNHFMFEPLLGNGGHVGLGFGAGLTYASNLPTLDSVLSIQGNIDCTYLFSNTQMRTFDLTKYGQWSRYLLFRAFNGEPVYPGANILTKKTTVSPLAEINALFTSTIEKGPLHYGLSYAFHFTPKETLKINDAFSQNYGIAHTVGTLNLMAYSTFSNPANITTHGNNLPIIDLPNASSISIADLDIESATQSAVTVSQLALSAGWEKKLEHENLGLGCTGGIMLNHSKAALGGWFIACNITLVL